MSQRLALHTWTLDVSPLADTLRIAKATGWDGVELRRIDFKRAEESGRPADSVLDQVRASGLPVACVGVEFGWMWADGAEKTRLLTVFEEQARRAAALGCTTMMSPVDKGRGDGARAAAGVREVGDIAQRHGVRLAVEFNSQCDQINTLERVREIMARASHPACGLLLDTYHLGRSGATLKDVDDVAPSEIAYVQYSDPPRTGLEPGKALDRLPPGQGSIRSASSSRSSRPRATAALPPTRRPTSARGSATPPRSPARRSRPPARCCRGELRLQGALRRGHADARPHEPARRAPLADHATAGERRAPRHRPLPRLQRPAHLAHGAAR